jgi:hypothetical protein
MKKSIDAASNLTEQVNKANVVFRNNGQEVVRWSQGLAQNFGLSSRAALEAAGTFGNMLVPMGFARDKAADMSEAMVQLGGDMASFNNASIEDTLLAIRSGLAGETEPLRKYGVFLSAARVQQEALAETGKKNAKQLTISEKALASYNIILKDTADTQGDFARSAGTSMANQLRIAQAQIENLAASVGSVLLPVVIKLLGFVNKSLIPAIGNAAGVLKDWFNDIQAQFAKAPSFKAKVKIAFEGIQELASKFVDATIGAIEGLLPQKPIKFVPKIDDSGLATTGGGVDWNVVAANLVAGLSVALEQSVDLAKSLAQTITDSIAGVDWVKAGRSMGPGLVAMLASAFSTLLDPAFWVKNWDLALSIAAVAFSGPLAGLATKLSARLLPAMVGLITRISPEFAAAMGRLVEDATKFFVATFGRVWPAVERQVGRLVKATMDKLGKLAVFIIKVLGVDVAINAVADFARAVVEKIKAVIEWFKRLATGIQSAFAGANTWLYNAGVAIIQGLWDGLKAKWDAVAGWLGGLAGKIASLKGPASKDAVLLTENGRLIMQSLQNGLGAGWAPIERWLGTLGDKMASKVRDAIGKMENAASGLASAMDNLASTALQAFDDRWAAWKPPAQRLLDKLQLKDQKRELKQAIQDAMKGIAEARSEGQSNISDAQTALSNALAGGDPEEIARAQQALVEAQKNATTALVAAQKQRDDALRAQRDFNLAQEAAAQQDAHDKRIARQRIHLQDELDQVKSFLAKHPEQYKEAQRRVNVVLKQAGVDAKFWGTAIGIALADGMREASGEVKNAAQDLAALIARYLKLKSPAEAGPMSDLDKWWTPFASTLLAGVDTGAFSKAGVGVANAMRTSLAGVPTAGFTSNTVGAGTTGGIGGSDFGVAEIHSHVYLDSTQIAEVVRREYLRFEKRNGRSAV